MIVAIILVTIAIAMLCTVVLIFAIILRDILLSNDAPFIPLEQSALDCLLHHLPDLNHKTFYELGCGDGRVLQAVQAHCLTAHCVGVEQGWLPYILAKFRLHSLIKSGAIKLIYNDIRRVNLANADIIFTYLMDDFQIELLAKFDQELKGGTIVISAQFKISTKKPERVIKIPNGSNIANKLYFYRF